WPPQSPDLNLIEALWGDIETELGQIFQRAADPNTLAIMIKTAWRSIIPERLSNLIDSMPRRLQAVIAVNGEATPY
ncbi:transposable element Tc1 transposase, partial [Tuber indicum]